MARSRGPTPNKAKPIKPVKQDVAIHLDATRPAGSPITCVHLAHGASVYGGWLAIHEVPWQAVSGGWQYAVTRLTDSVAFGYFRYIKTAKTFVLEALELPDAQDPQAIAPIYWRLAKEEHELARSRTVAIPGVDGDDGAAAHGTADRRHPVDPVPDHLRPAEPVELKLW